MIKQVACDKSSEPTLFMMIKINGLQKWLFAQTWCVFLPQTCRLGVCQSFQAEHLGSLRAKESHETNETNQLLGSKIQWGRQSQLHFLSRIHGMPGCVMPLGGPDKNWSVIDSSWLLRVDAHNNNNNNNNNKNNNDNDSNNNNTNVIIKIIISYSIL